MKVKCNNVNNKQRGFTLAEVLITLAIIGIVAAMCIPVLVNTTNSQHQQIHAKKIYSTISQAIEIAKLDNNNSYVGLTVNNIIANLSYVKQCTSLNLSECLATNYNSYDKGSNNSNQWAAWVNQAVILKSGETIAFSNFSPTCSDSSHNPNPYCGIIEFDINALQGPNTWGKDYFAMFLFTDGIGLRPAGDPIYDSSSANHTIAWCNPLNSIAIPSAGWGCMAKILAGQNY